MTVLYGLSLFFRLGVFKHEDFLKFEFYEGLFASTKQQGVSEGDFPFNFTPTKFANVHFHWMETESTEVDRFGWMPIQSQGSTNTRNYPLMNNGKSSLGIIIPLCYRVTSKCSPHTQHTNSICSYFNFHYMFRPYVFAITRWKTGTEEKMLQNRPLLYNQSTY